MAMSRQGSVRGGDADPEARSAFGYMGTRALAQMENQHCSLDQSARQKHRIVFLPAHQYAVPIFSTSFHVPSLRTGVLTAAPCFPLPSPSVPLMHTRFHCHVPSPLQVQEIFVLDDEDEDEDARNHDDEAPPARPLAADLANGHSSNHTNGVAGPSSGPSSSRGKRKAQASPSPPSAVSSPLSLSGRRRPRGPWRSAVSAPDAELAARCGGRVVVSA